MPLRLIALALAVMVGSPLCGCCHAQAVPQEAAATHACCHARDVGQSESSGEEKTHCGHCQEKRIATDARVEAPLMAGALLAVCHPEITTTLVAPPTMESHARPGSRPPPRGRPLFVTHCALLL